jgi:hypothetical protein
MEFSAASAAVATGRTMADVEERCTRLVGVGPFLTRAGTAAWPDGTVAERHAFRHALYRDALAAGVPGGRRAATHLRIGRALERAFGERSGSHTSASPRRTTVPRRSAAPSRPR